MDNEPDSPSEPTPELPAKSRRLKLPTIRPEKVRGEIEAAMPVVKDRAGQAGELIQHGIRKVIPLKSDSDETRYFKLLGISFVGLMLVAALVGGATFLLTLRNPESVAVPRVVGMELPEAIDALQEFGLVASLEQRYFPDPSSKGKIMEQEPAPATPVRVGRDVVIVLSKGAMVDKIANYVGRNAEEVKDEIRSMFTGDKPLLSPGEITFVFDPADAGTIISQDPPPGTTLDRAIALSLLVSRGKDTSLKQAPAVLGLEWGKAISELIASDIPFTCELGSAGAEAAPGTVLAQEPGAAAQIKAGERLKLTIAKPDDVGAAQTFGLYQGALPEYAVPVEVAVTVVSVSGQATQLWRFSHPGGALSFPYQAPIGAELVVTVFGKEFDRRLLNGE
jgi:beta-lactam-binding protein with PASTA domain